MKLSRLQWLLLIANVLVWSYVGCASVRASVPPPQVSEGVPRPRHVEWTEYDVSGTGWVVCRPTTPTDSVTTPMVCMPLPDGTEFYVPRWVPGPTPRVPGRED